MYYYIATWNEDIGIDYGDFIVQTTESGLTIADTRESDGETVIELRGTREQFLAWSESDDQVSWGNDPSEILDYLEPL